LSIAGKAPSAESSSRPTAGRAFLKGWQRQEERSARPQTNKQLSLPQPLQFVSLIRQHKQLSGIRMPFNVMESARVVTYLIAKILMGLGAKKKHAARPTQTVESQRAGKKAPYLRWSSSSAMLPVARRIPPEKSCLLSNAERAFGKGPQRRELRPTSHLDELSTLPQLFPRARR
jgi:hypothetical protein